MNSFEEQIFKPSAVFSKKLALFCEPLKIHFNINYFYFHRVTSDGKLFLIGNNIDWQSYFLERKFYLLNPFYSHPDCHNEGIYSLRHIVHADMQNIFSNSLKNCNVSPLIQVMQKKGDGFDSYGFGSADITTTQEILLLRELPLLKMFYLRFREEFEPVFKRYEDEQADLLQILGDDFYKNKNITSITSVNRALFLNEISSSFGNLSPQEELVSKFIAKGYSSKEIGENLKLSKRTIEHYVENIKCKLKCDTKNQIAQRYNQVF